MEISNIDIAYGISTLLGALWIMIPAYVPNPAAAAFGGGIPIDLGLTLRDGKRLLGDGKTYRGFFCGIAAGIAVGGAQIVAREWFGWYLLPPHTILSVILLAVGALLGDMVKSFFKRRIGKQRGEAWLGVDQYDLVIGGFALLLLFDPGWVREVVFGQGMGVTALIIIWIVVLTPLLHRAVNVIGYLAGVKDVPW